MKHISFETIKGNFLAVKVPDDASILSLEYNDRISFNYLDDNSGMQMPDYIPLPKGNYQILSPLSEMTEKIAHEVVDSFEETDFPEWGEPVTYHCYDADTALEAFNELMQSLGIYLVNPYGKHPDSWEYIDSAMHMHKTDVESWEKKEANTGNWIILKQIE